MLNSGQIERSGARLGVIRGLCAGVGILALYPTRRRRRGLRVGDAGIEQGAGV
jgi:hypothetical protein